MTAVETLATMAIYLFGIVVLLFLFDRKPHKRAHEGRTPGGHYVKKVQPAPSCDCWVPVNWFGKRHAVGSIWRCDCGQLWIWNEGHYASEGVPHWVRRDG